MSANLQQQIVTRPILFSGPMVRAVLDRRKTQTRRVVSRPKQVVNWLSDDKMASYYASDDMVLGMCPYGRVGDRLWVRETFCRSRNNTFYQADFPNGKFKPNELSDEWDWDRGYGERWTPSIHMHRCYSRITLEITKVRVERLSAIDEYDAAAEGIKFDSSLMGHWEGWNTAKEAFFHLWESINGEGSWAANPWVWVVGFKVV